MTRIVAVAGLSCEGPRVVLHPIRNGVAVRFAPVLHDLSKHAQIGAITAWGPALSSLSAKCGKHGSKRRRPYPSRALPSQSVLVQRLLDGVALTCEEHMALPKPVLPVG